MGLITGEEIHTGYKCPIFLHKDDSKPGRYYATHSTGVHAVNIACVEDLRTFANGVDGKKINKKIRICNMINRQFSSKIFSINRKFLINCSYGEFPLLTGLVAFRPLNELRVDLYVSSPKIENTRHLPCKLCKKFSHLIKLNLQVNKRL